MSILQEYAAIRKRIGEEKYQNIEKFLETHPDYLLSDVYYREEVWNHFLLWEIKQEKNKKRQNMLRHQYGEYKKRKNDCTVWIK